MKDSWKVAGEGEHYVIRILLSSGEHIEYELPHMPVMRVSEHAADIAWEYESHIYHLGVPKGTICETISPRRFADKEILNLIDAAKAKSEK